MTPLRRRMIQDLTLRNRAPRTIQCYVRCVARFARHFGKSPEHITQAEIRTYLLDLIQRQNVAHTTYTQTVAALKFLSRVTLQDEQRVEHIPGPRRQRKLPVVLSSVAVDQFFAAITRLKHRAILMTAYAAGLRVSEATHLQVGDLCHPSPGRGRRPPHHPGPARAPQPPDHRAVYPRLHGHPGGHPQPLRAARSPDPHWAPLMPRPRLEVADVFRGHGDAFLETFGDTLSSEQRRAFEDLARCRTAALGGHVEACDRCGHRRLAFNSCRNRHCPKCQATAAARWMETQAALLLPV